ncbi:MULTISPECIES: hypothetical protein [unclassified Agrococcus]|uniref:hypothetical protein n=1 Tax=unclassified Agrococcus TaxID=2615065 RepID=UPI00361AF2B2
MTIARPVAILAAALAAFALAACSSPSSTPSASSTPTESVVVETESEGDTALAGTTWTGSDPMVADVTFTLNADGTVDFADFNGDAFDSPSDVWVVVDGTLTMTITEIQNRDDGSFVDIVYTGAADLASMQLSGIGSDGGTAYSLSLSRG